VEVADGGAVAHEPAPATVAVSDVFAPATIGFGFAVTVTEGEATATWLTLLAAQLADTVTRSTTVPEQLARKRIVRRWAVPVSVGLLRQPFANCNSSHPALLSEAVSVLLALFEERGRECATSKLEDIQDRIYFSFHMRSLDQS
jgi:hypothetical protein